MTALVTTAALVLAVTVTSPASAQSSPPAPEGGGQGAGSVTKSDNKEKTDAPDLPATVPEPVAPAAVNPAPPVAPPPDPAGATEPVPAPTQPGASDIAVPAPQPPPPPQTSDLARPSRLRIGAWSLLAATVTLATAGAVLGLGAASRADELERQLNEAAASNPPPLFTADFRMQQRELARQGRIYDALSISCFSAAAAAAISTGVLFHLDHRVQRHVRTKRLALLPLISTHQVGVSATGAF